MLHPRLVELSGKVGLKSSQEKPTAANVPSTGCDSLQGLHRCSTGIYPLRNGESDGKQADIKKEAADYWDIQVMIGLCFPPG